MTLYFKGYIEFKSALPLKKGLLFKILWSYYGLNDMALSNGLFCFGIKEMGLAHIKDYFQFLIDRRLIMAPYSGDKGMFSCIKIKIDLCPHGFNYFAIGGDCIFL